LSFLSLTAAIGLSCGADPAGGPLPSVPSRSAAAIPAALRASYLHTRQNEAVTEHVFQVQQDAPATYVARNPGHGVAATLDARGLRLRSAPRPDLAAVSLTLQQFGCAAAPRVATPTPPRLGQGPNRVEYWREGAREWYVNGPLGLEHGFTLDHDPGCGGDGKLAFALSLGGDLAASLTGQGAATRLELRDPSDPKSAPRLLYSDLFALDADGRELPSRMLLVGRTVRLEVDAAGARYPVTVDPTWTQQAILVSADGAANDFFGAAVAVDGDTAAIGAPMKTVGAHAQQGQAYVFARAGTSWSQQAVLVDSATGAAGDWFGMSVSLSGDTAIVGAGMKPVGANTRQGQAYVFVRAGTSWSQQAILVDSATGSSDDRFGSAVALSGDTAVIGARFKTVGATLSQGQAYVFVRAGTSWSEQAVLVDSATGEPSDYFGNSVALDGDTAVIGAPAKTVGVNAQQGQAYVFVRSGTSWFQQAVLADSVAGAAMDAFGVSVALSGDTLVISAPLKTVGANAQQGQAYVFVRSGASWSQLDTLFDAATGAASDSFGSFVALSKDTAVIGAHYKTVGASSHQGQGYVFIKSANPNGTPCKLGSECASTFCADGFCCNAACGGDVSTDCQSCSGAQTGGADGTCGTITRAASYTCRPAATACDKPELCDGTSDSCPTDELYQPADHHLCRAATFCSRDTYCDGRTPLCPPTLCLPPWF
jgi:hypothetical protein